MTGPGDDDTVVAFRRRSPPPAADPRVHPATRRAQPAARELAAQQNTQQQKAYRKAQARETERRLLAEGRVVPARITIAMNLRGLEGPGVDERCGTFEGNPDGDVDRWELGICEPTAEQVRLMAELTDFPVAWFYAPLKPGPLPGDGPVWVCWGGRRGCEAVPPDVVDERGVLLYEGKPRELPPASQGRFPGMPDPEEQESPPKPRRAPASRKPSRPAAEQPRLPSRMPDHLREELMGKLNARRRPGPPPR